MNNSVMEFAKKNWKWAITFLFAGASAWVTVKNTVVSTEARTTNLENRVVVLEKNVEVQKELNRMVEKKLDKMDDKLDRLLTR